MSVHCEKISKDKHRFIVRIGRDPRRLQLLFQSGADKSSQQMPQPGGGQPGFLPFPKFSNTFSIIRYSIKLQSFCPPREYQLGTALSAR